MKTLLCFLFLQLKDQTGEKPDMNWEFGSVPDKTSGSGEASLPNGKRGQRA